jgi:hypothetical protein
VLVLLDRDLDDRTAELGGDIDAVALDVGVVGFDVTTGRHPEEQRGAARQEGQRPHENARKPSSADTGPTRDRNLRRLNRDRRCLRRELFAVHYLYMVCRAAPTVNQRRNMAG